jgi:O-antigen ligase
MRRLGRLTGHKDIRNPIRAVSFVLIQLFWISLYSQGVFLRIGGIRTQVVLLLFWLSTILIQPRRGVSAILFRLRAHRGEFVLLLMFLLVTALNLLFGRGAMAYGYAVRSLLLLITYVTVVVHLEHDHARYAWAAIAITVAIGVAALYVLSLIAAELYVNPFSITHYDFQRLGDEPEWFGSWSFYMACAIPMPCLIAVAFRQHGLLRLCLLGLCLSTIIMLVLSTFAASVILVAMGLAGMLLLSIRKPKVYVIVALIGLACVGVQGQFDVTQIMQVEHLGEKIGTIFDINVTKDYDDDPNDPRGRLRMMKNSWRTFVAHPLFGVGTEDMTLSDDVVGNHSGIIDSLAQFGVLGLIWYVIFLGVCLRRLFADLRRDWTDLIHQARLVTFIVFLAGAMINPIFFDVGLSALVFILALSPIGLNARGAPRRSLAHS